MKVNVRVIAASNQNLSDKVKLGEFREDLYYRLNVMKISLPPLRERREDIPLLVEYFIKKFNDKFNKEINAVSTDVQKCFMEYAWPGNVRELEHTLEHSFILCQQPIITLDHLPPEIETIAVDEAELQGNGNIDDPQVIIQALEKAAWNKTKAASLLGISRRSIYRKIKEHNIIESEA